MALLPFVVGALFGVAWVVTWVGGGGVGLQWGDFGARGVEGAKIKGKVRSVEGLLVRELVDRVADFCRKFPNS